MQINIMEVCGTHTMAIARSGIKSLLPENIKLISGPGCPVCVTSPGHIDAMLDLAGRVRIATYGDMLRVPGSNPERTLRSLKAEGADIEIVYSPMDAVRLAAGGKGDMVFLGIGFETTAPGTAMAIMEAKRLGLSNFSVFSVLKRVEPALRALMADPEFNVQGFLCPGHVATITGEGGFTFLADDYNMPAAIAGFTPESILKAIAGITKQIKSGKAGLINEYKEAVTREGNLLAVEAMKKVFGEEDTLWRGLGLIKRSGLGIRPEYAAFDAAARYGIEVREPVGKSPCRCGDVIQGKLSPRQCPLFGKGCTPESPKGPCMVSSEGSCAAEIKYNG